MTVAVAAAVAVVAMLAAVWVPGAASLGFNAAWTAAAVCALTGLLRARRAVHGARRAPWTGFALAAACWLLGQVAWDVFAVVGAPPSPNLADAGFWGFGMLVMVGLLRAPGRSGSVRAVHYAEALPLLAAALALTWALLWSDAAHSTLPLPARLSALAYPALYVSAAVMTMQAMLAGTLRHVGGAGTSLVLSGIVAQALAFVLWSHQLLDQNYVIGQTLIDPLWVLGLLAIGAGGTAAARAPDERQGSGEPSERGVLLGAVVFALLIAALAYAQLSDAPLGARLTLTVGLTLCGLALTARGVLLSRQQRTLLVFEREARAALSEREAQLQRLTAQLTEDSRRDPLTGLRNRRSLAEDLPVVEQRARRRSGTYALVLCDVDHFKAYNDQLGHLAGDEALRALAAIVRGELRAGDVAYRYGGEELLVVMPDADLADAGQMAERLRSAVAGAALPHPSGIDGVVTLSVGVAAGDGAAAELLDRADALLYAAKHSGRNRVAVDGDVHAPTPDRARARVSALSAGPTVRHLQRLLAVSRAALDETDAVPVLEALAETIRCELRFTTVVANLRDGDRVNAVAVLGDVEAREALLATSTPWSEWETMLDPRFERCGAAWLQAGTYDWSDDMHVWTPAAGAHTAADAWDPEDALLLPLRDHKGEVLAIIAVDEPLNGRRPDDATIELLMAVAEHGAAVLEQIAHQRAALDAARGSEEQLAAVLLLAESVDLRDADTARHSQTVGSYARAIAQALDLPPERVARVQIAGVLHDLGKLAIPDAVLHKPGALDDAEWQEIRRHPEIGARILAHAGLTDVAEWVYAHHERIDGNGYPLGLAGEQIPLEARILAVADAFEAMIADRPYRAGVDASAAIAELLACAGSQFDPRVVEAFLPTVDERAPRPASAMALT